jgi:hypothetical protein
LANFIIQCLILGGGHPKLNGGTEYFRAYPCGFEESGAKKLGDCLASKGWISFCDYLMALPSNIKFGDVLIYHSSSCSEYKVHVHVVFVTQGGPKAKIACHSNG